MYGADSMGIIQCPNCGGNVGTESCSGCLKVIPYYLCSHCKQKFFSPYYRSGLECQNCKTQVIVHHQKSMRPQISHYICQNCKTIVESSMFVRYSSCKNCTPRCKCGGYLATNSELDYHECVLCHKQYLKD